MDSASSNALHGAPGQIIPALAVTVGAEWCTELEPVQVTKLSQVVIVMIYRSAVYMHICIDGTCMVWYGRVW